MNNKPSTNDYPSYFQIYIEKVPEGNIIQSLENSLRETTSFIQSLPEDKGSFRYAPDKWSIKDVIQHIIDTERVFAYRLLTFSRNDQTSLPGYEQDDWAAEAKADYKSFSDLIGEYQASRLNTLSIVNSLSASDWSKMGNANGKEISVNALVWIIAGHEAHHLGMIKENYL